MSNVRFSFNSTQSQKLNVKLLYISRSKYGGDWHSTIHTHPFTELFYVIKGQGSFIVEDEKFQVREDDLVIVNSSINHTEVSFNSSPLEYIVLGIEGLAFFEPDTDDLLQQYTCYNYSNYRNEVLFYLKALLHEIEYQEPDYDIICQDLLEVLIINIIRRTNYKISISSNQKISKECAYVKNYIDNHFTENVTLDYLASLAHTNKYYLVHAFNKYMGISPINYLIEKRIEESKHLLSATDHSISDIANIAGFSSQSYFSQVFRKNTGITPNQFRKNERMN